MSMLEWAKREVEIASKRERGDNPEDEWDYGVACYESALRAFESLCGDGHSGMSISITKNILNRLIDGKPLTPIEDTEDLWEYRWTRESTGEDVYQCNRMGSLFKHIAKNGKVTYSDTNSCYCTYEDNPTVSWSNGFVRNIYDEMFPITMPYMPSNKSDVIVCNELLTDPNNGDFDTIAILYIKRANGERVEVNRFFKESGYTFEEISKEEYAEREAMDRARKETLQRYGEEDELQDGGKV